MKEAERKREAEAAAAAAARTRFNKEQALWADRLKMREANLAASNVSAENGGSTEWNPSVKMDSSIKKCFGYWKKLHLPNDHTLKPT